jgi:hypothetical protein
LTVSPELTGGVFSSGCVSAGGTVGFLVSGYLGSFITCFPSSITTAPPGVVGAVVPLPVSVAKATPGTSRHTSSAIKYKAVFAGNFKIIPRLKMYFDLSTAVLSKHYNSYS